MQSIYEEVFSLEKEQVEKMKQDVTEKYETASRIFPEAEADEPGVSPDLFLYLIC